MSLRGGGMLCQVSGEIEDRSSSVVSILIRREERVDVGELDLCGGLGIVTYWGCIAWEGL